MHVIKRMGLKWWACKRSLRLDLCFSRNRIGYLVVEHEVVEYDGDMGSFND